MTDDENKVTELIARQPVSLVFEYTNPADLPRARLVATIYNQAGVAVTNLDMGLTSFGPCDVRKQGRFKCSIPYLPLPVGEYRVATCVNADGEITDLMPNAVLLSGRINGVLRHEPDAAERLLHMHGSPRMEPLRPRELSGKRENSSGRAYSCKVNGLHIQPSFLPMSKSLTTICKQAGAPFARDSEECIRRSGQTPSSIRRLIDRVRSQNLTYLGRPLAELYLATVAATRRSPTSCVVETGCAWAARRLCWRRPNPKTRR